MTARIQLALGISCVGMSMAGMIGQLSGSGIPMWFMFIWVSVLFVGALAVADVVRPKE